MEATGRSRSDDSEDRSTRRVGATSLTCSTGAGAGAGAGVGEDFEMMGCEADLDIPVTLAFAIFSLEGRWPGCLLYGWNAWTGLEEVAEVGGD